MTTARRFYSLGGINAGTYDIRTETPAGEIEFYVARARASGGLVLELGCGTGRITWTIARAGVPIVGLDIERAMLERAEAKRPQETELARARARFVAGDMSNFSLDERFALAIVPFRAFLMLLTVEAQQQTLACIHRHLAPGGTLIIDIFDPRYDLLAEEKFTPRREVPSMHNPITGNAVSVTVVERINDRVQQRATERWRFREEAPDGTLVTEEEELLEIRWIFRNEMRHLFSLAGFVVEEEMSDYLGAPPAYGKEQIWVVRRD
jgi:ubiquinone/menaquinone biosynthesis C-methylase UbiE